MTLEEFESFLGEYTDQLEDLDGSLTPLVNRMVNDLISNAPRAKENGGDLKRSIVGGVRDNEVEFGWLGYGTYQNFGVSGTKGTRIKSGRQAPFGITNPIELGPFKYKSENRKWGLSAKPWFDVDDMARLITEELERITNIDTE